MGFNLFGLGPKPGNSAGAVVEVAMPAVDKGIQTAQGRFRAVEIKSVIIAEVQAQSW